MLPFLPFPLFGPPLGAPPPPPVFPGPFPPVPPAGPNTTFEWAFGATPAISIADFSANTGLLTLPTYVSQDGTQVLQLGGLAVAPVMENPIADAEFRIYYPFSDPDFYRPVAMSEPLTGAVIHKVFIPFLARALHDFNDPATVTPLAARNSTGEDGILFRKNEVLLVVITRYAYLDAENTIVFLDHDPPGVVNTTGAAVYRTRNLLLTVGE